MEIGYWYKQGNEPLFPDLLWSRPENRAHAGKLLVVGGHAQSFAAPAEAYGQAVKAGIGTARVLLPDSLQKTVSKLFPEAEFASSNPSGGFAQNALSEVLTAGNWADAVLIAGNTGRNSETVVVLETFLEKFDGLVTITKDTVDYFTPAPAPLLQRQNTTLVLSFAQLQKLAANARFPSAFTFSMGVPQLVETLHAFTQEYRVSVITKHLDNIFVAVNGRVSSTQLAQDKEIWRVKTAAHASVWQLQNPTKPFEALTTAIYEVSK